MTIWQSQWSLAELQAACRVRNLDILPRPTERQCRQLLDEYEAGLYTSGPSAPSSSAPPPTSGQSQAQQTSVAAIGAAKQKTVSRGKPQKQELGPHVCPHCKESFKSRTRAKTMRTHMDACVRKATSSAPSMPEISKTSGELLDDYEFGRPGDTSGLSDPSSSAPPPMSAQSQDHPTRVAAAGAPVNDGVPSDQGWTCMDGCGATFATAARVRQHEVQVHNIPYPKVINGIDGRCPCGCGLEWLSPVWFRSQHSGPFDFPIPLIRPVILARRASSPQLSTSMPRISNTSGEQETSNGHNTGTGEREATGNGRNNSLTQDPSVDTTEDNYDEK